ncbi:hypothetical protein UY3_19113 [Chelonia mydas]|uniref:Myb/SANT-like DNA-binding domain-containing protein n=1 Tax=Chelonia mydas TaxID=8469 RepID=M7B6F6_CHEMY|nr:hypothetical protein UY3_19113 [Chelonia mydas]
MHPNQQCYDDISKKLAKEEIEWTGFQHKEKIKFLKTMYKKAMDHNTTSSKLLETCPFHNDFDQVLGTSGAMVPPLISDDLWVQGEEGVEQLQQEMGQLQKTWSRPSTPTPIPTIPYTAPALDNNLKLTLTLEFFMD